MREQSSEKPQVSVVGAGPAGLMAAETLALAGASVTIFDQMASPARKFLMAGRGGLNLTHSEDFELFMTRFGSAADRLRPVLTAFSPADLRRWCDELDEATFVGTSGRVFPKSFKASPLLRAWLRRLGSIGVKLELRHRLSALDPDLSLTFQTPEGQRRARSDAIVLALGGASWPRLGSNGEWTEILAATGIALAPWRPTNCGFEIAWSQRFRERFTGSPIKAAAFSFRDRSVRGEAMISARGIEGGAIYALSAALRDAIETHGEATVSIDLRPDLSVDGLGARLARARPRDSLSQRLRKAGGLSPVAIGLLRESGAALPHDPSALAQLIKNAPVLATSAAPIARAISSAGGVALDGIDEDLMLRGAPGAFVCGEMLDFEAPTGGYLLQAAFSTGVAAGRGAVKRLNLKK